MPKKHPIVFNGRTELFSDGERVSISLIGESLSGRPRLSTGVDTPVGRQLMAEIHRAQVDCLISSIEAGGYFHVVTQEDSENLHIGLMTRGGADYTSARMAELVVDGPTVTLKVPPVFTAAQVSRLLAYLHRIEDKIDAWTPLRSHNALVRDLIEHEDKMVRRSNRSLRIGDFYVQLGSAACPVVSVDYGQKIPARGGLQRLREVLSQMPSQKDYPICFIGSLDLHDVPLAVEEVFVDNTIYCAWIDDDKEYLKIFSEGVWYEQVALHQDSAWDHYVLKGVHQAGVDPELAKLIVQGLLQFDVDRPVVNVQDPERALADRSEETYAKLVDALNSRSKVIVMDEVHTLLPETAEQLLKILGK